MLEKVEATLACGWVVSVDLLCGLPLQTLEGFVAGIETLMAAGVDGFSLSSSAYASYLCTAQAGWPGLEGGLRRNPFENRMQPLVTTVLSGHIPSAQCLELKTPEGESPVERWQARGLVEADPRGGLTASGAWFAGNLIAELTGQGPQQVCQA